MNNDINTFHNLKNNWDGYGAKPIDPRAIAAAKRILESLVTVIPVPRPNGGIQIEAYENYFDMELGISPDGTINDFSFEFEPE